MKSKILILLWHPHNAIAGGFIRTKVLLSQFKHIEATIIDNSPTLIHTNEFKHVRVISYNIPKLITISYKIHYALGRFFEWSTALFYLIKIGRRELANEDYSVIYGPTGDNLHIFLAGVVLKILFPSKKLLLDVLNLEMPEGGIWTYYKSFRRNNVSMLFAIANTIAITVLLFVEKKLIHYCDHIVTVSPYMKLVIAKYYPIDNISVTPSGVTIENGGVDKKIKKTIDGLFVGRHTKEKGIFDVLKVWKSIVADSKDMNLETVGVCPDEVKQTLNEKIDRYHLLSRVVVNGVLSEEEKWEKYKKAKVFMHLAYHEPLVPVITILEALSCGVPVVTYYVPAIEDYPFLKKNPALIVINNGDIEIATKEVKRLLTLPADERNKIEKSAIRLAKQFSWPEIAQIEENVIHQLVQKTK